MAGDWENIQIDKEKYAAYLCSREWAERREAVRERANNTCERCKVLPMDACHHLTYERKYNERLEDLQAICTPCHEFTHGKCDADPRGWEIRKWLYYAVACKAAGKDPVDDAWFFHCECQENQDAIERAVKWLFNQSEKIERIFDNYCSSPDSIDYTMVVSLRVAAEQIDKMMLNTGMYLWLEYESPKINPIIESICQKWVGYTRKRPIRKAK